MIKVGQFLSSRLDILPPRSPKSSQACRMKCPRRISMRSANRRRPSWVRRSSNCSSASSRNHWRLPPSDRCTAPGCQPTCPKQGFQEVVVKIQRPFIDQLIEVDFSALHRVAGWIMHYEPIRKRVTFPALIKELENTVHEEIDYLAEAGNAETFRRISQSGNVSMCRGLCGPEPRSVF